jgi:DNA replication protein DnaC
MVENNGQPEQVEERSGPGSTWRTTDPPSPSRREEDRDCSDCGAPFTAVIEEVPLLGRTMTLGDRSTCPACRQKAQEEDEREERERQVEEIAGIREDFRRRSGLPIRFWHSTFDAWPGLEWPETRAMQSVRKWIRELPERPVGYPSLILHSPEPGHGMSTLAGCAINYLIDTWPIDPRQPVLPVRYETGPGLGLRVRTSYNIRPGEDWRETEGEVYDSLRGMKLLVLDDVGDSEKEPRSEHTRRVYFHLLDLRYRDNLPLLIITNSDGDDLRSHIGAFAYDRLSEMSGRIVRVAGQTRAQRRKRR